jgi:hypothetical protein
MNFNGIVNFASLAGIILLLFSLPAALAAAMQIRFLIGCRKERTTAIVFATVFQFIYLFARLLGLPFIGGILFFQGWKLEPIFGFTFFLLGLAYISELVINFKSQRDAWRLRKNLSNPKPRSI